MKNSIKSLLFIILSGLFFVACEGPEGPAGEDGIDGNAVCLECHNAATQSLVAEQYEESTHGTSNTMYDGSMVYEYANRVSCAKCHNNEGFKETQHTGLDTVATAFAIATRIQCETCHEFHETLDFENDGEDFAMRKTSAIALLMDDGATTIDFGDNSNLCGECHQPRTEAPTGSGDFTVTSSHYGPHHGTQATILEGIKGYEVSGTESYPSSQHAHRTGSSCVKCHMNEQNHTMEASLATCNECHDGLTDFDLNNVQTTIESKLAALQTALKSAGLLDADGGIITGTYPVDHVGALYNYEMIVDDKSMGIHNPPYIKALLQNSIEALQ